MTNFSPRLFRLFGWYSRRYLQRHFHAVRLLRNTAPVEASGRALVVYGNHASWWDPLVALFLTRYLFVDRTPRAPIDAAALARYRFFGKLGFFGVEQGTRKGAATFLRTAHSILNGSDALLWLTPQGRFADARERPTKFRAGFGHLARRHPNAVAQAMAGEFVFWEEKRPEILLAFGEPFALAGPDRNTARSEPESDSADSAERWTERFEEALTVAQDRLAAAAIRRDPADFTILLRGRSAIGGVYDSWRRARAWWRGETFRAGHGVK